MAHMDEERIRELDQLDDRHFLNAFQGDLNKAPIPSIVRDAKLQAKRGAETSIKNVSK